MSVLSTRRLLLGLSVLLLAGVVGAAVWTGLEGLAKWRGRERERLSSFGTVPEFALIERSGRGFTRSDLRGKVWVANFIYTACTDTCPLQSALMAKLQREFADRANLRLLSISVDPQRDTPPVLSRYAERFRADPERWLFLTGEGEEIHRLVREGFRLSAVPASAQGESTIVHSSRFVLVDGNAEIRGYYDSGDAEALRRLGRDLRILLAESEA